MDCTTFRNYMIINFTRACCEGSLLIDGKMEQIRIQVTSRKVIRLATKTSFELRRRFPKMVFETIKIGLQPMTCNYLGFPVTKMYHSEAQAVLESMALSIPEDVRPPRLENALAEVYTDILGEPVPAYDPNCTVGPADLLSPVARRKAGLSGY